MNDRELKERFDNLCGRIKNIEDWLDEFMEMASEASQPEGEIVFVADEDMMRDKSKDN